MWRGLTSIRVRALHWNDIIECKSNKNIIVLYKVYWNTISKIFLFQYNTNYLYFRLNQINLGINYQI